MTEQREFSNAIDDVKKDGFSRRSFVRRAAVTGVGMPVLLEELRATGASAQTPQPASGGTVTVALSSEPTTINEYFSTRSADGWIANLVIESLLAVDPEGNYTPALAAEVPTLDNGGVSADGLVITYRLKQGVLWSDGQPFTSADVKFTFDMVMNEANPVSSRSTYEMVASIETPDEHTVVVTWSEFFAPYLELFGGILPSHYFDGNTDISQSDFDRNPVGTGPFTVASWEASTAITFTRNDNYREGSKPYLDQVIFVIVPSPDVATAQLQAGEVDLVLNLREDQVAFLQEQNDPNVQLLISVSPSVERVHFNLASPGKPADPAVPHPILGDVTVRQALDMATPKQAIVEQLIGGGLAEVAGSTLPIGWAAAEPPIPPTEYNPERAGQMLDEAGWAMGDDGVRQKDGQPLRLRLVSTPEQLRTLVMQFLAERWGEIGVALEVSNQQSAVLLGSWEENGTRDIGDFDSMIFASSAGVDPHTHFLTRYLSEAIPSAANGGEGRNTNRLADPLLDELIVAAGAIPDQAERTVLYRQVNEQLNSNYANVWLYFRSGVDAYQPRVGGLVPQPWGSVTFNSQDWFVTG